MEGPITISIAMPFDSTSISNGHFWVNFLKVFFVCLFVCLLETKGMNVPVSCRI